MLDKSVPYAGFYMRRAAGSPLLANPLPEGYKFSLYNEGDEKSWAAVETSVLEFGSEFAALLHFNEKFMPFIGELRRRCLFIESESGEKIATAMAWWDEINGCRHPWLHWVGVKPRYQGLGLGKALISRVTELMIELDGDVDFYLHTQTWSYKAIEIYKTQGYQPTDNKVLYKKQKNNYKKAMRILKRLNRHS